MNAFDYLFEESRKADRNFLLGAEEIKFNELHRQCIELADWIQSRVGQNKKIILLSANNLFFLKVYLAILKSGNTCIPLDPNIEKDNLLYIDALTKPELIFLSHDAERRLQIKSGKTIFPDTLPKTNSATFKSEPDGQFDSEKCSEIIFTSGSTGKPKGVMISHKNIIANTKSIIEYLNLNENDKMLVVLPFYYCYGLSLLHTHLRVGGSIVLNNSFMFLGGVLKSMLDYHCTGFAGVPSHFQILLRKSDSFKTSFFPDLKYVTQAGGKLAPVFIDEFRECHPEIKFIVMYGQTEATARLSWLPPELYENKKGSMGKGIPGVELKVVNELGEEIKPGETGEVIARGDNIMMGYFADEECTKKTIRQGWLYTGDLGTVDDDGYIFLTARSKEMIKVGGKRVSPKEIEGVILQIPQIIDCTIEGIEDQVQGEALKATIVVQKGEIGIITEEYIKHHCSKHLALFKIPQIIVIKHELTISPTGKKIKNV
jgi:long-chain acyl-CoA synthetase